MAARDRRAMHRAPLHIPRPPTLNRQNEAFTWLRLPRENANSKISPASHRFLPHVKIEKERFRVVCTPLTRKNAKTAIIRVTSNRPLTRKILKSTILRVTQNRLLTRINSKTAILRVTPTRPLTRINSKTANLRVTPLRNPTRKTFKTTIIRVIPPQSMTRKNARIAQIRVTAPKRKKEETPFGISSS